MSRFFPVLVLSCHQNHPRLGCALGRQVRWKSGILGKTKTTSWPFSGGPWMFFGRGFLVTKTANLYIWIGWRGAGNRWSFYPFFSPELGFLWRKSWNSSTRNEPTGWFCFLKSGWCEKWWANEQKIAIFSLNDEQMSNCLGVLHLQAMIQKNSAQFLSFWTSLIYLIWTHCLVWYSMMESPMPTMFFFVQI